MFSSAGRAVGAPKLLPRALRENQPNSLRRKEVGRPLSRFPLRGKGRGGRVPPTPQTARLPPQEGFAPLCIPRPAPDGSGGLLFRLALTSLSG